MSEAAMRPVDRFAAAASAEGNAVPRVLVACIGNVFWGDDGFGVAVAERLRGRVYPAGVQVVDFGIRGVDLAYTLLDGCDTLVLVDAMPRGGPPGTLYLIEPKGAETPESAATLGAEAGLTALDAHSMDPVKVLAFARSLGARPARTLVLGCEPETPAGGGGAEYAEMRMGLSAPVEAAVDEAVHLLDALIARLLPEAATAGDGQADTRR